MNLNSRIEAFAELGKRILAEKESLKTDIHNPWFTEDNIDFSISELSKALTKSNLEEWIDRYQDLADKPTGRKIAVIMAGNIPLVGFHDFMSVLICGDSFIGKLSSKDDKLLPRVAAILTDIEPGFKDQIRFTEAKLPDFDAVIATGSNNTSRYFDYYFGKYPHIIRKNRNSVGIIRGDESDDELQNLCDDIFTYFGLGCRNVSKLFIPEEYKLDHIFRNSLKYKDIINHHKYSNNYDYNRAVYLLNKTEFKDNGMMLMKEDIAYASPVSVVYYERYGDIQSVNKRIRADKALLQCVVSKDAHVNGSLAFGESQRPKLWEYADNIDTIKFLTRLKLS
jgi:hypothetical protein